MSVTVEHRGYVLTALEAAGAERLWTATHAVCGPVADEHGRPLAYRGLFVLMRRIDHTFTPPAGEADEHARRRTHRPMG